MALIFSLRGNSLDARYARGDATHGQYSNIIAAALESTGWSGEIGGSSVKIRNGTTPNVGGLLFPGRNNTPAKAFSILTRVAMSNSAATSGIFATGSGPHSNASSILIFYSVAGTLNFRVNDLSQNARINAFGSWTPTVQRYYDIFIRYDGTNGANKGQIYIDGVLFAQATSGVNMPADSRVNVNYICLGAAAFDVQSTCLNGNELVIWDSYEDPTSILLTSGIGSLNGTSRTAFVDCAAFDGATNVGAGAANIRLGTNEIISGVTSTGSLIVPARDQVLYLTPTDNTTGLYVPPFANTVKIATPFGDGQTGTYDGSDRWDVPAESSVEDQVAYLRNGNLQTGSYRGANLWSVLPAAYIAEGQEQLQDGTMITGTASIPTPSGLAGAVDLNNIKETIRYVLEAANVAGGEPIDLSANLSRRIKTILKVNPEKLRPNANLFPCVTVFVNRKSIEAKTISKNQVIGKRRADVFLSIVGLIWNDTTATYKEDPADNDLENLMENIEQVLRAYADLNNICNWQIPKDVTYHTSGYDEQTHVRIGIMDLQVTVYY